MDSDVASSMRSEVGEVAGEGKTTNDSGRWRWRHNERKGWPRWCRWQGGAMFASCRRRKEGGGGCGCGGELLCARNNMREEDDVRLEAEMGW